MFSKRLSFQKNRTRGNAHENGDIQQKRVKHVEHDDGVGSATQMLGTHLSPTDGTRTNTLPGAYEMSRQAVSYEGS